MCNKLVIGIPTYNRQDKCYRLLEEIGYIDGIFYFTEIVVIDNSTQVTDKFSETIRALDFSENITYVNNGENKGLDWSSIRINGQWRLCFRFENGHAYDVEVVDYHYEVNMK